MLILASQSPRRAALLQQLQLTFSQLDVEIDESQRANEPAEQYVLRMAKEKAQAGLRLSKSDRPILAADTVVVTSRVLAKPKDQQDFRQMMTELSDSEHQVLTAICLTQGKQQLWDMVATKVQFKPLSNEEIDWYWRTGEPMDKAGGYAIQGLAGQFVQHIKGSYSAVVGLPLYQTCELLSRMGIAYGCTAQQKQQ